MLSKYIFSLHLWNFTKTVKLKISDVGISRPEWDKTVLPLTGDIKRVERK